MITGSVIDGRDVVGLMMCTPLPGMLKLIVSVPGVLLAQLMASRSEPAPVSLVFTTAALQAPACTVTLALNSDVLLAPSVAVATILSPTATAAAEVKDTVFVVPASTAT